MTPRDQKVARPLAGLGDLAVSEIAEVYFLPAFFAAQKAFNLADNLALVAELTFFLAFAAGLTERAAGLARRRFAHRVF
jgi:hypothetical protein